MRFPGGGIHLGSVPLEVEAKAVTEAQKCVLAEWERSRGHLNICALARASSISRNTLQHAKIALEIAQKLPPFQEEEPAVSICDGDVTPFQNKKDAAVWEEDGNRATAETLGPIHTLEGLIEACKIDLDVWHVERWVANQWQQGTRIENQVRITPLWQVKAWLVRKVATITEFPTIYPVVFNVPPPRRTGKPHVSKTKTAFCIPDSQNGYQRIKRGGEVVLEPFHDRKAWDTVMRLAHLIQPDLVLLLGDHLDLPEWTDKFIRSPDFFYTTQPALDELGWLLAQLRRRVGSRAEIVYIEGNHEARLSNYVAMHLGAAYDLKQANMPDMSPAALSIPNLLNLQGLGIKYLAPYPEGEYWLNSNLSAGHGETVRTASGDTVKAILHELRHSHICGHIHRCEMASETRYTRTGPRTYVCISPGTIARLDGPIPKAKKRMNWSQGCAVIEYEPEGFEFFRAEPIPIWDGRAIYRGKIVCGEDYINEFRRCKKVQTNSK